VLLRPTRLTQPSARKSSPVFPKVLHCRGLPSQTTETELVSIVSQFGRVAKTLILHDKNQAFIQMDSLDAAARAVAGLENPPVIRNKPVYIQYSSRQEIDHKSTPAVVGADGGVAMGNGTSATLIIMITNVTIPVTLDNIYQICKPYGDVLRIITFNKGMDFQALVEFGTADHAEIARSFLDGKDLFQGCCHLRVSFSKRQHLVVKQNDHKSRDFTQPDLPQVGGGGLIQNMGQQGGMGSGMLQNQLGSSSLSMGGQDRSPVVLVSKLDDKVTPEVLFTLFGVYGDVIRVKILFNKRDTALVQLASGQQADYARQNLNGCPLYGQEIQVANSKHQTIQMPREAEGKELTRDFMGSEFHRYKKKTYINPKNVNLPSAVLHVANIHESVSEQELRELFQSASPNARVAVEFFKTNRSQAYIALGSVAEGVNALINFHNFKVREYPLRVSFSPKAIESVRDSDST